MLWGAKVKSWTMLKQTLSLYNFHLPYIYLAGYLDFAFCAD